MRFTHSSLLTLSAIVTTSLFYQVNSLPVSPSDVSSPVEQAAALDSALVGRNSVWNKKIEKRCHHKSKHPKPSHKKHTTTKRSTTTTKKVLLIKKKSSSHKKTTTKKHHHKKSTTHKKAAKKTTKKKTTKKTTKKSSSGSSSSSSSSGGSFGGDGTYYGTGLGSCGIVNHDTEFIAALNAPQMNNGANPNNNPICGRYANVHGPKGSVRVKIVDTCPPCKKGDLDLSPAAFGKIADFAVGRVHITWSWA